jgi:hypothetical protein
LYDGGQKNRDVIRLPEFRKGKGNLRSKEKEIARGGRALRQGSGVDSNGIGAPAGIKPRR